MTVAELIARLQALPQDAAVVIGSCCYDTFDVTGCALEKNVDVRRDPPANGEFTSYATLPEAVFFTDAYNDPGHWGR